MIRSFLARYRRWVISVITGVIIAGLGGFVAALLIDGAHTVIPPLGSTTSPAAPTSPEPTVSAAASVAGSPTSLPPPTPSPTPPPLGPPLTVLSEVPLSPGHNMVWMLPGKRVLTKAQLAYTNSLLLTGQYDLLDKFFYKLGGYTFSSDFSFTIKNNRPYPIWIENIRAAKKICQAPLTGTLFDASEGPSGEPGTQLGINPDSRDPNAMRAPGTNVRHWTPDYYANPVEILPGAKYVVKIRAKTSDAACSFWYQVIILDHGRLVRARLGNEQVRVSAYPWPYLHAEHRHKGHMFPGYEVVYEGGSASPRHDGRLVQVYPDPSPRLQPRHGEG